MLVSIAVVIGLFFINFAYSIKHCGTDCVLVYDCLEAKQYLLNLTEEKRIRARKSFCGVSDKNGIKICCSDFKTNQVPVQTKRFGIPIPVPPITTSTTTTTSTTPKPEHPNLRLLPDTCGNYEEERIIQGEIASMYEFPWMALISYDTDIGLKFSCAGTLINSQYVLTAAHCVVGRYKIAGVRIGEYDLRYEIDCQNNVCESNIQDARVTKIIVHERYTGFPKYENDIALLRLWPSIDLNPKNAGTICLPVTQELRNTAIEKKIGKVTGWGLTEFNRESSILLKVKVPIRSLSECEEFYSQVSDPGNTQFCAGQFGRDSCRGDSGGPLMIGETYKDYVKYVQFGIVSSGPQKCGSGEPAIYTDVRKHVDWILDHIEE